MNSLQLSKNFNRRTNYYLSTRNPVAYKELLSLLAQIVEENFENAQLHQTYPYFLSALNRYELSKDFNKAEHKQSFDSVKAKQRKLNNVIKAQQLSLNNCQYEILFRVQDWGSVSYQ